MSRSATSRRRLLPAFLTVTATATTPPPLLLLLSLLLLFVATAPLVAAQASTSATATTAYSYILFRSGRGTPRDGANNTDSGTVDSAGVFCRPTIGAVVSPRAPQTLILADMCSPGSALRVVSAYGGLTTLAGSLLASGFADGNGSDARFGNTPSTTNANGLALVGDDVYLADTVNNAVRRITAGGSTTTFLDSTARYADVPLHRPIAVASYVLTTRVTVLFIADTTNSRILTTPVDEDKVLLSELMSGVQALQLVVSQSRRTLYAVLNEGSILARLVEATGQWSLGSVTCTGYISSLTLSRDEGELWYYGRLNDVAGLYTLSTDPAQIRRDQACPLTPTLRLVWTQTAGSVRGLAPYSDNTGGGNSSTDSGYAMYVITSDAVFVLSDRELPWPPSPPTPSSSSASSSASSSQSESSSLSSSSSSSSSPVTPRQRAVAAFPRAALPSNDSCLMSQLYYWMRVDAAIAFNTDDYYTQFVPLTSPDARIAGSVNVSTWCDAVHSRVSNDGTVQIVDYDGPPNLDAAQTQNALSTSPWTNTYAFLASLRARGWPLEPVCFYNCTSSCDTFSARTNACPTTPLRGRTCDGLCKGAIASSVTLGVTGVVLLILAAVSPAALLSAIIMVPVI